MHHVCVSVSTLWNRGLWQKESGCLTERARPRFTFVYKTNGDVAKKQKLSLNKGRTKRSPWFTGFTNMGGCVCVSPQNHHKKRKKKKSVPKVILTIWLQLVQLLLEWAFVKSLIVWWCCNDWQIHSSVKRAQEIVCGYISPFQSFSGLVLPALVCQRLAYTESLPEAF